MPSLVDTLLRSFQLQGSFYDSFWCRVKGPWHKYIPTTYHRWPEFWHYIYCFVQSGESFKVKRNKNTHHTNTHIHKHGSNNEKLAWNTQTENYKTFGQEEQNIKKQYETYVGFYNYPRKHSKISQTRIKSWKVKDCFTLSSFFIVYTHLCIVLKPVFPLFTSPTPTLLSGGTSRHNFTYELKMSNVSQPSPFDY